MREPLHRGLRGQSRGKSEGEVEGALEGALEGHSRGQVRQGGGPPPPPPAHVGPTTTKNPSTAIKKRCSLVTTTERSLRFHRMAKPLSPTPPASRRGDRAGGVVSFQNWTQFVLNDEK